jgi:hypothetical protein
MEPAVVHLVQVALPDFDKRVPVGESFTSNSGIRCGSEKQSIAVSVAFCESN